MIDNMSISSFGCIKDKKIEFSQGMNIVFGKNEFGKSTIHEALRTVLYGFSPATLAAHPYGPWDGSKIYLEADIRNEGAFGVTRALGDRPEGKLLEGNSLKSIANGPVTGIGNISRDIYRQLYAITLDDLSAISDKSWDVIIDGLIGSYGLEFIKSPTDAVKDIETRKNEIFRENRRGKYLIKEIDDELSKLGEELRELDRSASSYHQFSQELETLRSDKIKLKEGLNHLKNIESQILSLLDDKKNLNMIKNYRDSYGIVDKNLGQLTDNISQLIEEEKKIRNLTIQKASIEDEIEFINSEGGYLSEEESRILRKKPDFIIARNLISNISLGIEKLNLKNGEAKRLENQLASDESKMFGRGLSGAERTAMEKLDTISLAAYVEGVDKGDLSYKSGKILRDGIITAVLAVLSGAGAYFNIDPLFYIGLILTGIFLGVLYGEIKGNKNLKSSDEGLTHIVEGIPVPHVYINSGDRVYFDNLAAMCPRYSEIREAYEEAAVMSGELEKSWDRMINVLEDKNLSVIERFNISVIKGYIDEIYEQLDEIRAREIAQNSSRLKLNGLTDKLSRLNKEIEDISSSSNLISQKIKEELKISDENFERLKIDLDRLRDIADLEEQFEGSYDGAEKVSRIDRLEGEGYEISLSQVEDIKGKMDSIISDVASFEKEEGALVEKMSTIYDADERELRSGRVRYLKDEKKRLLVKRAVLSTAQDVIEKYDGTFRSENQPDIVRRASHYFSKITQGRYTDLYTDERSRSLFLTTPHGEKSIDEGFSRGTKEQLYLALRLAIIEHLDKSYDTKLPLILDDVFVNWDKDRMSGVKELTDEISRQRQVIMFTCHKDQVELFKDDGKSNIIFL